MSETKRIIIGSCRIYFDEFTGALPNFEELKTKICVEEKVLGLVKNGASVEYTPTFYEAKDDLGLYSETYLTEEEAKVKSGIMTINQDVIKTMTATGRAALTENSKYRIIKIGGITNDNGKSYVIVLHHQDKKKGDIWVIIVGKNHSGFTLSFAKNQETVIDAEFKCSAQDNEGTLIQYVEEIKTEEENVAAEG